MLRCCERACPRCPVFLSTTTSLEIGGIGQTQPQAPRFPFSRGGTPWVRDWRSSRQHNSHAYRPGCISPRETPASHSTHSRSYSTQSLAWLASRPVRGRSGTLMISLCASRQSQCNNNLPQTSMLPSLDTSSKANALVLTELFHQCSY